MAIVTPTDRPKSVRNRCVYNWSFRWRSCVVTLLFCFVINEGFYIYLFLQTLLFGWLLVLGLYEEDYLDIFKRASFRLTQLFRLVEGWNPVNQFNHTSLMAVVTNWPMSVRNRCVIEHFGCVFVLSFWFFLGGGYPISVGDYIIGPFQISSFFS